MPSLQEIKARKSSVQTTRKITKAMQLVATAKLRKSQTAYKGVKKYRESIDEVFDDIMSKAKNVEKLFPIAKTNKTTFIIITSDIGLCGGYNSNIIKMFKKQYKPGDELIVIGKKGNATLRSQGYEIMEKLEGVGNTIGYSIAEMISKIVISQYGSGMTKTVKILHTTFTNSVTYEATTTQLLPLEIPENDDTSDVGYGPEFEPSMGHVLKGALPLYISALIYTSLSESKVSEMSSRRVAMENATDNATDLIDALNIQYNRARQATITQEINEIVAGADAE